MNSSILQRSEETYLLEIRAGAIGPAEKFIKAEQ